MVDVVIDYEHAAAGEVVDLADLSDDAIELLAEGGNPGALVEAFRRRMESGEVRPDASGSEA